MMTPHERLKKRQTITETLKFFGHEEIKKRGIAMTGNPSLDDALAVDVALRTPDGVELYNEAERQE